MNRIVLVDALLVVMAVAMLVPIAGADPMSPGNLNSKWYRNTGEYDVAVCDPNDPQTMGCFWPGFESCAVHDVILCPARSVTIVYGLMLTGAAPDPGLLKPICEIRVLKSRDVDAVVTVIPSGWSASGTGIGSDTVVFSATAECAELNAEPVQCLYFALTVYDAAQEVKESQCTMLDDAGNVGITGRGFAFSFITSCPEEDPASVTLTREHPGPPPGHPVPTKK